MSSQQPYQRGNIKQDKQHDASYRGATSSKRANDDIDDRRQQRSRRPWHEDDRVFHGRGGRDRRNQQDDYSNDEDVRMSSSDSLVAIDEQGRSQRNIRKSISKDGSYHQGSSSSQSYHRQHDKVNRRESAGVQRTYRHIADENMSGESRSKRSDRSNGSSNEPRRGTQRAFAHLEQQEQDRSSSGGRRVARNISPDSPVEKQQRKKVRRADDADRRKPKTSFLQGMSSRLQVKYLMEKTCLSTNWDMDNDSEFKGGSDCDSEDDHDEMRDYYEDRRYWKATRLMFEDAPKPSDVIDPSISGIGGCWGLGTRDGYGDLAAAVEPQVKADEDGDTLPPFFVQYERRMEHLRRQLVRKENRYRLRMLAYSTLQFKPIKQNKFLDRKRAVFTKDKARTLTCACQKTKRLSKMLKTDSKPRATQRPSYFPGAGQVNQDHIYNCGEKCVNRCMNCECSQLSCPSYLYCTNRHFQLFQDRFVYPVRTSYKGWGLAAGEFIPKGSFIMQYVGEIFNVYSEVGQKRIRKYKKSTCTYLMRIDNNEVIDPTTSGNIARFINHSCDPNCQTIKWQVLDEVQVGIFAIKDIAENEELTFNYQFDFFKTLLNRCYCGSKNCKGFLGVATGNSSSEDEQDASGLDGTVNAQPGEQSSSDESEAPAINPLELPSCSFCSKPIRETKKMILCTGSCNQFFHLQCALKNVSKKQEHLSADAMLRKRKFLCKTCFKSGQSKHGKRGRKTQKEREQLNRKRLAEEASAIDVSVGLSALDDSEARKIMEDSPQNLLIDRLILVLMRRLEGQMRQLMTERLKKAGSRVKRGQMQMFSDHYTFMFELMRRVKPRLKRVLEPGSLTFTQNVEEDGLSKQLGPGGCRVSFVKFRREFPEVGLKSEELTEQALRAFLDGDRDPCDELLEELGGSIAIKKRRVVSSDPNVPKRKRGRPPKARPLQSNSPTRAAVTAPKTTTSVDVNVTRFSANTEKEPAQTVRAQHDVAIGVCRLEVVEDSKQVERQQRQTAGEEGPREKPIDQAQDEDMQAACSSPAHEQPAVQVQVDPEILVDDVDEEKQDSEAQDRVQDVAEDSENGDNDEEHEDEEEGELEQSSDDNEQNEIDEDAESQEAELESSEGALEEGEHEIEEEDEVSEQDDEAVYEDQSLQELDEAGEEEQSQLEDNEDAEEPEFEQIELPEAEDDEQENDQDMSEGANEPKDDGEAVQLVHDESAPYPKLLKVKKLFSVKRVLRKPENKQLPLPKKVATKPFKIFKVSAVKHQRQMLKPTPTGLQNVSHTTSMVPLNRHLILSPSSQPVTKEQQVYVAYKKLRKQIKQMWQQFLQLDIDTQKRNQQVKPACFNVNERVFNMAIKNHVDLIEQFDNLQVYWDKPFGGNVTVRTVSTRFQYDKFSVILQYVTNEVFSLHAKHRIDDTLNQFELLRIQVPKNFIRKLVGYQEKFLQYFRMAPQYEVDFYYNRELLVDEIFRMDEFTHLRVFGRRQHVLKVAQILMSKLDSIVMKSILIQKVDCTFVMDHVKEIKSLVDPCELRIRQTDARAPVKDLRHPFLYLPNYLRDIILIGTYDEIRTAERQLQGFLRQKREGQNYLMNQQLSFLLPLPLKSQVENLKSFQPQSSEKVQIYHYMPTYPRKHLTVTLIGPWYSILQTKEHILAQIKGTYQVSSAYRSQQSHQSFEMAVFFQQIRFAFKNLKRYILEKDIKFLSHWDIVSVFVDSVGRGIFARPSASKLGVANMICEEFIDEKLAKRKQELKSLGATAFSNLMMSKSKALAAPERPRLNDTLIETLLSDDDELSDRNKSQPDVTGPGIIQSSLLAPLQRNKTSGPTAPIIIDRAMIIQEHLNEIEQLQRSEAEQLIRYISQEDAETCINVLYVLSSSSQNENGASTKQKSQEKELESLMEKLRVTKHRLVYCMQQVLNSNLNKFLNSLGVSRSYLKEIETGSDSELASHRRAERSQEARWQPAAATSSRYERPSRATGFTLKPDQGREEPLSGSRYQSRRAAKYERKRLDRDRLNYDRDRPSVSSQSAPREEYHQHGVEDRGGDFESEGRDEPRPRSRVRPSYEILKNREQRQEQTRRSRSRELRVLKRQSRAAAHVHLDPSEDSLDHHQFDLVKSRTDEVGVKRLRRESRERVTHEERRLYEEREAARIVEAPPRHSRLSQRVITLEHASEVSRDRQFVAPNQLSVQLQGGQNTASDQISRNDSNSRASAAIQRVPTLSAPAQQHEPVHTRFVAQAQGQGDMVERKIIITPSLQRMQSTPLNQPTMLQHHHVPDYPYQPSAQEQQMTQTVTTGSGAYELRRHETSDAGTPQLFRRQPDWPQQQPRAIESYRAADKEVEKKMHGDNPEQRHSVRRVYRNEPTSSAVGGGSSSSFTASKHQRRLLLNQESDLMREDHFEDSRQTLGPTQQADNAGQSSVTSSRILRYRTGELQRQAYSPSQRAEVRVGSSGLDIKRRAHPIPASRYEHHQAPVHESRAANVSASPPPDDVETQRTKRRSSRHHESRQDRYYHGRKNRRY